MIQRTTRLLQQAGINAGAIHQGISVKERRRTLDRFKNSASASVLINYMALTEGTDLPHVDCVIIGRYTASESTIIQMIGRGQRPYEQKEDCLVLEYTRRPDMSDIIHYWRLDSPVEEKERAKRERAKNNTPADLQELATRFPRRISMLDNARIQYPWFKPFDNRPIMALPLWSNEGRGGAVRHRRTPPEGRLAAIHGDTSETGANAAAPGADDTRHAGGNSNPGQDGAGGDGSTPRKGSGLAAEAGLPGATEGVPETVPRRSGGSDGGRGLGRYIQGAVPEAGEPRHPVKSIGSKPRPTSYKP